eukprot:s621_g20.t1
MPPKKASRQGSSKNVGDPSPTSTEAKRKAEARKAELKRQQSDLQLSWAICQQEEAEQQLKETIALKELQLDVANGCKWEFQLAFSIVALDEEKILKCAMSAANANNRVIGAGFRHSAVISNDGGLICFGTSGRSQCDVPHPSVTAYRPYESVACGTLAKIIRCSAPILQLTVPTVACFESLSVFVVPWIILEFDSAHDLPHPVVTLQGHLHTCAATIKGQLIFFGETCFGQCSPPELADVGVTALCAGYGHSCILDTQGRLHCFGDNVYGQCAVPIELASTKVVSIAAGFRHSCAVTAQGVLLCFGDNSRGQCTVPPSLTNVRLVAAGDFHTCAITADGKLHCFGSNDHGQCNVPKHLEHFIAVAAGSNFTMAILFNGNVWCGGSSGHGQCDLPDHLLPEAPEIPEVPEVESDIFSDGAEEGEEELPEAGLKVKHQTPRQSGAKKCPCTAALWCFQEDVPGDSIDVNPTEEPVELPETDTMASDMEKRMRSTFGSMAENQEETAKGKIQVLHEKLAAAWEDAEALAAKYVDRFRGLSAGCFHNCLLQADGQLLFFGDDSANQCTMPEGLIPKVSIIDTADLPVGILAGAKPKLLLPPEPPASDSGEAVLAPTEHEQQLRALARAESESHRCWEKLEDATMQSSDLCTRLQMMGNNLEDLSQKSEESHEARIRLRGCWQQAVQLASLERGQVRAVNVQIGQLRDHGAIAECQAANLCDEAVETETAASELWQDIAKVEGQDYRRDSLVAELRNAQADHEELRCYIFMQEEYDSELLASLNESEAQRATVSQQLQVDAVRWEEIKSNIRETQFMASRLYTELTKHSEGHGSVRRRHSVMEEAGAEMLWLTLFDQ